jgi:hypothetical protein
MHSVLVRNDDGSWNGRKLAKQQHPARKGRWARILGGLGKMKNIPYYFIAGFSIFGCMVTGMALASGADYIRYQAEVSAQGRIFNAMTIRELSNVRVGDI